ncbi:MAG: siderophore-interacting protein [Pseudomonadota bacterium]
MPSMESAGTPGRLSRALLRLLMKRATVVATEPLADRFRLITLEGPALQGVAWTPGQKIQIAMGSAFVARTYTPLDWDAAAGRTSLLAYAHGEGPGSRWVRRVRVGDPCDLFGPRKSVDVPDARAPLALFGDETSIGLACALVRREPPRAIAWHFEVDDAPSLSPLVATLGIGGAALYPRRADDAHVTEMEAALPAPIEAGATFVLTGKAGTLQRLRHSLKRQAVPTARVVSKAYWAPGKSGLD